MVARRAFPALLLALGLAASGCGGSDDASRSAAPDSGAASRVSVTLQQPRTDGGTYVEGFIAAYAVDPDDPATLTATQYAEPVTLDVSPGTDLLVLVHPCDARCQPWDAVARQLAESDRDEQTGRITRCRTTIDTAVEQGVALQPIIDLGPLAELGPDGAPCRVENTPADR